MTLGRTVSAKQLEQEPDRMRLAGEQGRESGSKSCFHQSVGEQRRDLVEGRGWTGSTADNLQGRKNLESWQVEEEEREK